MIYQGLSGTIYETGEKRLNGGGEGNIYPIVGNSDQVVKIFKQNKRSGGREEKLRLMIQEKLTGTQMKQVTWPQDIIYDSTGFAGYVMPRMESVSSLIELYSTETYDLRFRLMAAINLCAAIDTVHEMGQVCGDLNPQNIFINLNKNDRVNGFKVTLVDTDSYHFTANGKTYRCEVGLGEFIAPELQNKMTGGRDLKSVPLPSYTRETDLFALAVHIFCLLMNGCHPFACAKDISPERSDINQMSGGGIADSVVAPQPIENIKSGFFPFYEKREGIIIPIYAPGFESLPESVRELFIRTFVKGYREPSVRATAREWQQVLLPLLENIKMCPQNGNHYYFGHMAECCLCKVENRIKGMLGGEGGNIPPLTSPEPEESEYQNRTENVIQPAGKNGNETGNFGGVIFVLACFFTVIGIFVLRSSFNVFDDSSIPIESNTDVETKVQQYAQLISDASAAINDKDYDSAISYCDKAIQMSSDVSNSEPYYWKGKALYAKGNLKEALETLEIGEGKNYSDNIGYDEYDKLIQSVKRAIRKRKKAKEKEKADAKKVKKLNKIIFAIKSKKYKNAGALARSYYKNHDYKKIYIQNSKLVKKIKSGKGFMIENEIVYYGNFRHGKKHGKGIEIGGNYYKIQGVYKNGKLNGRAAIYQWNQKLGNKTYHLEITGIYRNNKENGRMRITYYYKSGGVMNTYYCTSSSGKRRIIRYDSEVGYVYAKTSNGKYCIGNSGKKWLLRCGHPRYFYT